MAKTKGKGAEPVGQSEYLNAAGVAEVLGISLTEHLELSSNAKYPKPSFGPGNEFLGYSRESVMEYRSSMTKDTEQAKTDPAFRDESLAAVPEEVIPDPFISLHSIDVPTTSEELSRCLAFSRGFSTQWTADEMLRWRKLIGGLVRQNASYIDYQDKPERRQAMVRSTIQSALKWLLRAAVPLTLEELQMIHLGQKASGDEPGVKTRE